jgi:phosphoglycerate-specific signal transduction histidine kinase
MTTMDHERLRRDLKKLHSELQGTTSIDESEQRMLRRLESDIAELLAREGDDLTPDADLRQRLSEALAQVEASHPRITLLMRQMVDSLAYLGV